MYKNTVSIALKGIAIATGVAVIVINIIGTLTANAAFNLLGIGTVALGIVAMQK